MELSLCWLEDSGPFVILNSFFIWGFDRNSLYRGFSVPHNFIKIICGKKCSIVENVLLYIVFLYIDFHCWDQEKSSSYPFVVIMILCLLFRNTVRVLTAIYCRPTFRLCSMSPNEEDERRHPAVSLFVYSSQKSCITEWYHHFQVSYLPSIMK